MRGTWLAADRALADEAATHTTPTAPRTKSKSLVRNAPLFR